MLVSFLTPVFITINSVYNLTAEKTPLPLDVAVLPTIVAEQWLLVERTGNTFKWKAQYFTRMETSMFAGLHHLQAIRAESFRLRPTR